ncbi:arf-GAP domain and FG repeat-containing protein 2 isoform X1 [Buteo buteo]|uniref:arf-GAP domain and FG repeat-containing protein 2 isoform X1 n=1 Tax=Buteo buteo TaxID=30397 RepID=UPI003EBD9877
MGSSVLGRCRARMRNASRSYSAAKAPARLEEGGGGVACARALRAAAATGLREGGWRRPAAEEAAPGRERDPVEAPGPGKGARPGTQRLRFGAGGRGLNPPHRVKSISMTTFTEAEVLFLQARGNEACRRVWLGTFDTRNSLLPDSRDPQKVKEFLQEKYEKKRWYVAPETAKTPQSAAAEPAPTQPLLGDAGMLLQPRPAPHRPPQPARKASTDLLADIGGDPFAAPQPAPAFAAFPGFPGPALPRAAFPSFDAFGAGPGAPAFGGAAPPFHAPPAPTGGAAARGGATSVPPPEGGASASLFGTLRPPPALPPPPYGGYTNPFAAPAAPRPSTNPFQSNGPAASAAFAAPPVPEGFPSPFQADGSPFGAFNVAKASTNPFVTVPAPTAPFSIKHPTTNPFL